MSGKHRLYYSTRCRFCQAFLQEVSNIPGLPTEFQLICVDPSPSRPPLPGWLKSVPSLVVAGEGEPRVGPGPVNNWLFERKNGLQGAKAPVNEFQERRAPLMPPVYNADMAPRPDATARAPAPSRGIGGAAAVVAPIGDAGPAAYHGSEMAGGKWSDNYSFLEDTLTTSYSSEKGMNRIVRNFESLVAPVGSGGAGSQSMAAPSAKRSAKEDAQLQEFEAFIASRNRDVAPGIERR